MTRAKKLIPAVALVAVLAVTGTSGGASTNLDKPAITSWHIPFPTQRKTEMRAYANRHYGLNTFKLKHPHVIVEHYSVTSTVGSIYSTFAPDQPDSELHELPGVCSHFAVASSGQIFKFVNTSIMCRHTVGLNYTAIGIEHVGFSDADILNNRHQLRASLNLTRYLKCRFNVKLSNVIGHNESLSSPWHHELVPALRNQTHQDWNHADMNRYRSMLAKKLAKKPC